MINQFIQNFENKFFELFSLQNNSSRLIEAMQYSCLNGGKRLRPLLVYASGIINNANDDILINVGMAIELIHCYSLIHDDLPAMDNDDLRRGIPTCHKQFGEGMAILAGDALQSLAFEILSSKLKQLPDNVQLKIINLIAKNSGVYGMCGGQALDLSSVGISLNHTQLKQMHQMKTGALIQASILSGFLCGDDAQNVKKYNSFAELGNQIGLLFQIVDDILDVTQNSQTLGKTANKDSSNHKPTYVSLFGLDKAQELAKNLHHMLRLKDLTQSPLLIQIIDEIATRSY